MLALYGNVAEWLMALVLKTSEGRPSGSSNLPVSATPDATRREFLECGHNVLALATAPEAKQRKCPKCSLIGTKQFYGGV